MNTINETVKKWWAAFPMTYGTVHGQPTYLMESGTTEAVEFGEREFFERLDATFYSWTKDLHTQEGFFGKLFPYERYKGKNVLEIGCGLGTMAMNWAQHGARVTAVDLNPVSIAQTSKRFRLFQLPGTIQEMDARELVFSNAAFDYVYSWGVLHHSPDLDRSVEELFRVLRPGGGFSVMLYNRASIFYWYLIQYLQGHLHGESQFLNHLQLASRYTDGGDDEGNPHTWPVTRQEARRMFLPYSDDLRVRTYGSIEYAFPPKVGAYLPESWKRAWARRWGWSLCISGTKR